MKFSFKHFVLITILCFITSCNVQKKVVYFQDQNNLDKTTENVSTIKIEPYDKLTIIVNTPDPELSAIFNLATFSNSASGIANSSTAQRVSSYTVDPEGYIDFPELGKIHVAGLSRNEINELIKEQLIAQGKAKKVTVTTEFYNMVISVIGEVAHPGKINIEKDKFTILEAISTAGDLTIFGVRSNVMVSREEKNGERTTYRVDLTNAEELYKSPVFYLKQNDVVYVEPNNMRARQSTVNGNNVLSTSFWISLASLLTSMAVLIFK